MAVHVECVRDADGVAVLRASGAPFGPASLETLEACIDECLADDGTSGVVLASAEEAFVGELDLEWLHGVTAGSRRTLDAFVRRAAALAARIDASRKPFAAAISGNSRSRATGASALMAPATASASQTCVSGSRRCWEPVREWRRVSGAMLPSSC